MHIDFLSLVRRSVVVARPVYASDDVLPLCFRAEREPGGRPLLEPLLKMR